MSVTRSASARSSARALILIRAVSLCNNGHQGDRWVRCFTHGDALYIKATPAKEAGNPGEHPEFVLDQHRNDMLHGYPFLNLGSLKMLESILLYFQWREVSPSPFLGDRKS